MIKSYKIRLYPTKQQEEQMWQHIGACRFMWNYMLSYQEKLYETGGKHLSAFDMIRTIKILKSDGDHDWLYEISNASLQTICRDLNEAYQRFFKKISGSPKFKSRKRSKPSYPVRADGLYFKGNLVQVQKIGKVKYKTDFEFPEGGGSKFSNPRISFVDGKWMLSFGMECENQAPVLNEQSMGIDLGIKDLAIAAYGKEKLVFHNINKSRKIRVMQKRTCHTQRSISRKYEQSRKRTGKYEKTRNIEKLEASLRKQYARMANIRLNYVHQTTHTLVSKLPNKVIMEDLNISGMMKNRHLSKAIAEQCLYEFLRQMKYKCEWNGIEFIQVDRFYPSSKTCSVCGRIKKDLKLSDRTYKCDNCGTVIDRDYNAAINLMKYAA